MTLKHHTQGHSHFFRYWAVEEQYVVNIFASLSGLLVLFYDPSFFKISEYLFQGYSYLHDLVTVPTPCTHNLSTNGWETAYLISDSIQVGLQIALGHVQEAIVLHVSSAERQDVDGSQSRLLPRWYKHYDWFLWRVLQYGVVRWLGHSNDSRCIVSDVETLKFTMQGFHTSLLSFFPFWEHNTSICYRWR